MRVFFMWSGEESRRAAHALRELLEATVQGVEYFISDDIESGTLWRLVLSDALQNTDFGIASLTPDNLYNPWIHFEAGAIAKVVTNAQVIPVLIGLDDSDIDGPLSGFQCISCNESGVNKLVRELATKNGRNLDIVEEIFRWRWPQVQPVLSDIEAKYQAVARRGTRLLSKEEQLINDLRTRYAMHFASEQETWEQVERALIQVRQFFEIEGISAYASVGSDFTRLEMKVQVGGAFAGTELNIPNYETVLEFQSRDLHSLSAEERNRLNATPVNEDPNLQMLGLLREVFGGRVVFFGITRIASLSMSATMTRLALVESLNVVAQHLDQAFQGISLDLLSVETAHNLGRALAGVSGSRDYIKELLSGQKLEMDDRRAFDDALLGLDGGIERLSIIRSNFYSFSGIRLVLSQAEDSTRDITKNSIDVPEIASRACKIFEGLLTDYGNKGPILRQISSGRIPVLGSPEELLAVLHNLLDNALKFSFEHTEVNISVTRDVDVCTISISNTGLGIPQEERLRVFSAFVKSSVQNGRRSLPGMGLGLPYCKRIVEYKLNGTIDIESTLVSKRKSANDDDTWRTTVRVVLPIANEPREVSS